MSRELSTHQQVAGDILKTTGNSDRSLERIGATLGRSPSQAKQMVEELSAICRVRQLASGDYRPVKR